MGQRLKEIALLFFRLGLTAFGGPAAHIGMMEAEVVTKRSWMSRQHFLDLVGATNLIPGPNSTEMALHCGYQRAGVPGLLVAGATFLFPAVTLTGLLAFFYVEYGQLPAIEPFFRGIKPAVLAIILGAVYKLGKKALKGWELGAIGAAVAAAGLLGVNEVIAILAGGVIGMLVLRVLRGSNGKANLLPLLFSGGKPWLLQHSAPLTLMASSPTPAGIFFTFLKVGAILFGSGYVLVAYLEADLVDRLGWLTQQELLDAIAMGQFTPGPVLSTSTFIGYQLDGLTGALLATAGIFLPSFLFVLILNPIVPKLRKSAWAGAFLDAVNISAVGIMVSALYTLGEGSLTDWRSWVIALAATAAWFGIRKANSLWIVAGGALAGWLLGLL